MARKLILRILVEDADGFKTSFRYISESMASFRDIRNLLVEILMTMIFLRTNFFSFTMQTPRKTQNSLMTAMDRST